MSDAMPNQQSVAAVYDRRTMVTPEPSAVIDRRYSEWLRLIVRWLLAVVFIVAGALKIADPKAFALAITDYNLVPELFVPVIAVVLPWWEVIASVLAFTVRWRIGALTVLTALSAAFLIVGGITFARGLSPNCGCFSFLSERVGPLSLAVEAVLLTMTMFLLRHEMNNDSRSMSSQ